MTFENSGRHPQWPKVANTVIEAIQPVSKCRKMALYESHPTCQAGYQTVAIAIAELVEKLHQHFPGIVVKSSEPYEDEDICLVVYVPWDGEERQRMRNQIYELEFELHDKYEVEGMVKALPLDFLPNSEQLHK